MRSPLAGRPLRVKLSLLMVVLLSLGLFVSSLLATAALRGFLIDRVDEQLMGMNRPFRVDATQTQPVQPPQGTTADNGDGNFRPPGRFYIEVIYADGTTSVIATPGLTTDEAVPDIPSAATIASLDGPITVGSTNSSDQWRIYARQLDTGEGWVVAAASLADVQATTSRLVLLQVIVGAVVVLIGGGVGYVIVRRSLKPLGDMSTVAHEIAAGDLSLRVPETHSSAEVDQLADSFNTMVGRIEESFEAQAASERQARSSEERMRRFVADASHELRTPLTSIRGFAELIEQGAADDDAIALAKIQEEATRMGVLVDDLLLLARIDQQRPFETNPVELLDVVTDAIAAARAASPSREITLTIDDPDDRPIVNGDARRLRQVFDNLLSNADRYSPDDAPIEVSLGRDTAADGRDWARVSVTDHGPGLGEEDQEKVFERLYRTDEARSRVHGGSGLGLSIVRSLVVAHGGQVTVTSVPGNGATFTVLVPAA